MTRTRSCADSVDLALAGYTHDTGAVLGADVSLLRLRKRGSRQAGSLFSVSRTKARVAHRLFPTRTTAGAARQTMLNHVDRPAPLASPGTGMHDSTTSTGRKRAKVAVTGFGPFHNFPINPSWQCVKVLDGTHHTTQSGHEVEFDCFEVPTVYDAVLETVPRLHGLTSPANGDSKASQGRRRVSLDANNDYEGPSPDAASCNRKPYDVLLHVGVAPSRPHISLEKRARRYGYEREDASGKHAPSTIHAPSESLLRGFGDPQWRTTAEDGDAFKALQARHLLYEEELETSIDVQAIASDIDESGLAQCRVSTDAGLFLCEFIYFASLSCANHRAKAKNERAKPVLFVHIPPENQPYDIQRLTRIVEAIVSECVDRTFSEANA